MAFFSFCKVDGITGESQDADHKDFFEIITFSHTVAQAGGSAVGRTGGATGGRADVGDFTVTKVMDSASANLSKFCCSGKHVKSVVIEVCAANEKKQVYMKYTLSDAVIASVRAGGHGNSEGARPLEEVSFRFSKIQWEYTPYDNKGAKGAAVKAGWDVAANKEA